MTTGPPTPASQPWPVSTSGAYKWIAFAVVSLGTLMSTMDGSIVLISLPALSDVFETDPSIVAWIGIAYFLTGTSLLLTMAWLGDFLGRERIYVLGVVAFTIPLMFMPLAQNVYQLIAWRAVQGVGSAMILATTAAIVAAAFPERQRGLAFGLTGGVVGIGLGSGTPLGGIILDVLDWRALFYARVPLGVVAAVLGWMFLDRGPRTRGPLHLDTTGSALLLLALGSLLLAVSQAGRLGITSLLVVGAGVISLVLFPLFLFQETRARRPIVELRMFRNPTYSGGVLTLLAHSQAWIAVGFLMPFAMIDGLGYGAARAGLVMSVFSLVRSFTSPVSGWLSDRIGHHLLMGLGVGILAVGLLLLSQLSTGATLWQIVGVLAVASFGSALFEPSNTASIMSAVPSARLAMAGASIATGRQIGFSVGIAVSGAILAAREAHHLALLPPGGEPTSQMAATALIRGAGDALLFSAFICALGILPIVLRRRGSSSAGSP